MPFIKEALGVDAGLMSFIQDTKRKTFRDDALDWATSVPVKVGDHYHVSVDMSDDEIWGNRVTKLTIERAGDGEFIIEDGCENIIISDPCYIMPTDHWSSFCNKLYVKKESEDKCPLLLEHYGVKVAVSSSGYGDGCYECTIETDDSGNLKKAFVVFIDDSEDEDVSDEGAED